MFWDLEEWGKAFIIAIALWGALGLFIGFLVMMPPGMSIVIGLVVATTVIVRLVAL
jgi:hypothetical protein